MPRPDLEHRMHLLEANRAAVMVMLAKAVATGKAVEDLVAVVADTPDSSSIVSSDDLPDGGLGEGASGFRVGPDRPSSRAARARSTLSFRAQEGRKG